MRSSTRRAEASSGPVLVAAQQLVSSLAEADAAATAAFLSGRDEDPEQRRLYEEALARAGRQVEEIASLAGRDPDVRAALSRASVQVTRYAGLIEAARASNRNASPDANGYLVSAVQVAEQLVGGDVKVLTDQAQATLGDDEDGRGSGFVLAAAALAAAAVALALAQWRMVRIARRIVNPPLALATVLTVGALGWLAYAHQASGDDMVDARRQGYDSIVLTARLASAGFGAKAAETLALITNDPAQRREADALASQVASAPFAPAAAEAVRQGQAGAAPPGLLRDAAAAADSRRERAASAEAGLRWQRYQDTVSRLRGARDAAAARAVAVGPANADFNGFNFSVQSVLGQNRGQFLAGLGEAAGRTGRLPPAVLLLLVGALATMFWGFQLRINDYR